jgi:FkbM family methyltransferase
MPRSLSDWPLPIISQRLRWLVGAGVEVGTVIDAGVQGGTRFLMTCFPDRPHLLFEPVDRYFSTIRHGYRDIRFELFHAALSDDDGKAWQIGRCVDGSGQVTHSQLSDSPISTGSGNVVECKPVDKMRLDTALEARSDSVPYLLKLDVDGHEIPILRGARKTLTSCSVVVCEANLASIGAKTTFLEREGFALVDIVDLCYYHSCMSQVDLIFVHRDWVAKCADLRPWHTKQFSWDAWANLSTHPLLTASAVAQSQSSQGDQQLASS